jgi:hypothetical protein
LAGKKAPKIHVRRPLRAAPTGQKMRRRIRRMKRMKSLKSQKSQMSLKRILKRFSRNISSQFIMTWEIDKKFHG